MKKKYEPAYWLDFTCKTEKTIAADDSENSSNEIEDSNPRPVVIVPLDDIYINISQHGQILIGIGLRAAKRPL